MTPTQINRELNCDIFANNRLRINVYGRMMYSFYLYNQRKYTLEKIGKILSKGHATIIHYLKEHETLCRYDKEYRNHFLSLGAIKIDRYLCKECKFEIKKISL